MSRKPAKARASSSKAFGSTGFGTSSSFGAFSSSSSGTDLSYLAEPPDFSSISDANVVVLLKNLQKKDATTKAKALEELVSYVQAHPFEKDGGTEEPVLEAWVQLYPRIAIDEDRRVRQLSHTLQFELRNSARKRMDKHSSKIVGPWLAGTFDRDGVVSQAATEGLSSFLTTPEKTTMFWRRCQQQILDYASDSIKETVDTLSDERSTSADEAKSKYYRVLQGSLALVLRLLQILDQADIEKCIDSYDQFFENDKVWASAVIDDHVVRRLSCQLLSTCLEKRPGRIEADLLRLSKVFVAEGLKSSQVRSSDDFVQALSDLTSKHPSVWTSEYRGKKPPSSQLRLFLEKGSQRGTIQYWSSLSRLLGIVPDEVLPTDMKGAAEFMKSMRAGLTNRDESPRHAVVAWSSYLTMTRHFLVTLESNEDRLQLVRDFIFPLTAHYLFPSPDTSIWSSGCHDAVLMRAFKSTAMSRFDEVVEATKIEWGRLKDELKDRTRSSLPEASEDYQKSQKSIAEAGERWFAVVGKILDEHEKTMSTDSPTPDIPAQPSIELIQDDLDLLVTRNWKPFGAASTVESAVKKAPSLFKTTTPALTSVLSFLETSLPENEEEVLNSPSAPHLFACINLLGSIPEQEESFSKIWEANCTALLGLLDNHEVQKPQALEALVRLVSSRQGARQSREMPPLQVELVKRCLMCAVGMPGSSWDLFEAVVRFEALTFPRAAKVVKELSSRVVNPAGQPDNGVIRALHLFAQNKPELLTHDEEAHISLMANLLRLSEGSAAGSEVSSLRALLATPSRGGPRLLGLVQNNINRADMNSLPIDSIAEQAMQISPKFNFDADDKELLGLLPDIDIWTEELQAFVQETPDPSLALTSTLQGAYFIPVTTVTTPDTNSPRDKHGCSIPGRMALYVVKLFASGFDFEELPINTKAELIICLGTTLGIAIDQINVMSENKIWSSLTSEKSMLDAENFTSSARLMLGRLTQGARDWISDSRGATDNEQAAVVCEVFSKIRARTEFTDPFALYCARVLSDLIQNLTENHGFPSSGEEWLANYSVLRCTASTVLAATAVLHGLGSAVATSRNVSNFCNRLVSDVAGANLDDEKSLWTLVLLNACTQVYEVGELPVANNRLVFAVRQITSWLETPDELDYRFAAEACRLLQRLLPCIKDVYGPHWEKTVDFCIYLWTKQVIQSIDCRLPEIDASLRLMSVLDSLEDPNENLVDVLETSAEKRSAALLELLKLPRVKETVPLGIVDSLICRQVEKLPLQHVKDPSELYGLVASESRAIQTAAFTVLHKTLPAAQEQLSIDVLLEEKDATLPDELLSLLLDAPTLDAYPDDVLSRFPLAVRGYLLSWLLVFDCLRTASFKVRNDYAENLKSANYVSPLMEFMFDVLGHSAAHALNLDKAKFTGEHIRQYDLNLAAAETEERDMQWLLIHLYYLVLKYVPGLFKAWYIDCRSKQTKIAVEGWMAKHFSPIIISEALDDVVQWNETQETSVGDDQELIVTVSRAAKEVTAGYEVDDLRASIAIRIPQEFPLEGVSVVGINRVAVNEKKWQSWIMTTQGVITFSGGSIIDGLATFRRNVVGALKGQTECAICYSIISSDKKMPDKRCQTCKNLFHRTCLYKWFQSSSQNTCPLCRNPIDYLGADTKARRGGPA
ncbi:hypothetical protein F4780DRAFT_738909 [Xylariomycetidae sp. FL0641]|nr:hypothetical protein F4780DRAFT_738909 [Xylariomycetidae sp. FL0641]